MSTYTDEADDFLQRHGWTFSLAYVDFSPWPYDEAERPKSAQHFKATFRRKETRRSFSMNMWLHPTHGEPTAYDFLAAAQKYDVGTIDDFIHEYGYEVKKWADVRRLQKQHRACKREYARLAAFCTPEELEELKEIN